MWSFLRRLKMAKKSKYRKRSERESWEEDGFSFRSFHDNSVVVPFIQLSTAHLIQADTNHCSYNLPCSLTSNLVYAPVLYVNLKFFPVEDKHFLNNVLFFVTPT